MVVREPRVQPPMLETYADTPLFNTKAVTHQTGVPAPTLRAWERRYGVLAPRRGANDYRLYSERDIMTVLWLRERVEAGLTISQAIALLRSLESARRPHRGDSLPPGDREPSAAIANDTAYIHDLRRLTDLADLADLADANDLADTPLASGGANHANGSSAALEGVPRRFALGELSTILIRQFTLLDEAAASRTIAQALAIYPIEDVCLSLLTPTLTEIGRLWATGEVSVTVEHFGSALVRTQLDGLFRSATLGASGPLALVGCAPGEQHELGALMLALFLRRAGVRVVYLGQNVEPDSLLSAISAYRPACVALSATLAPQAQTLIAIGQRLCALPEPRPAFYVGGQGFSVSPDLAPQAAGYYLNMNACDAAQTIRQRLIRAA